MGPFVFSLPLLIITVCARPCAVQDPGTGDLSVQWNYSLLTWSRAYRNQSQNCPEVFLPPNHLSHCQQVPCSENKQIVYCTIISFFQNWVHKLTQVLPGYKNIHLDWWWKQFSEYGELLIEMAIRDPEVSPSDNTNKILQACLCLVCFWWRSLSTMCGFCLLTFEVICTVILSSDPKFASLFLLRTKLLTLSSSKYIANRNNGNMESKAGQATGIYTDSYTSISKIILSSC